MGGWITLFGDIDNSDLRIQKFKRIFDVEGVPKLIVEDKSHTRRFKSMLWAWRTDGIPDVYVHSDKYNNVLILCGAVTDLGRFGFVNPYPVITSMIMKKRRTQTTVLFTFMR